METQSAVATSLRVGDVERQECVDRLVDHYIQGRLSADELDRRQHQALEAITVADLTGLVADLPPLTSTRPGSDAQGFWPASNRDCAIKLGTLVGVPATFATGGALVASFADAHSDVTLFACGVATGVAGYVTHWVVAKLSR